MTWLLPYFFLCIVVIAIVLRWIWRDKSVQDESHQHALGRSMLRAQREQRSQQ